MIKLSEWARRSGLSYTSAYNLFKTNKLPVKFKQLQTGTILVEADPKTSCKAVSNTGRSFIVELDLDLNNNGFAGADQKEILDKINELVDLIAEKMNFGVISKQWVP